MFKLLLYVALFILIVLFVLAAWVIIQPYTMIIDTIIIITGGNGSGKSFFSINQIAITQLRKKRLEVFFKNINPIRRLIKKQPKIPRPVMISNIPIRISLREMSMPLEFNPFVLQERFPEKCVVVIDEINLFLSQMDYKIESEEQLNESITLFRHQTKNGVLIANTQNVNKTHWIFRYCANRSYNLCEFRKPILGLPILAWVKCRHISIGDDIKTVEEGNVEEGRRNLFCFFPIFRRYDTHCYSDRYNTLPLYYRKPYTKFKRNSVMRLDKKAKFPNLLNDTDEFNCGGAGSEQLNRPTTDKQEISCKSWKDRKK